MRSYKPVLWGRTRVLVGLLGAVGCAGLESVTTHEAENDPTALYMALTLEHRAINLVTTAPYHAIQLVATPRDGRGEPMAGLTAPTFRLADPDDTTRLRVTPEGLVTALAEGSGIGVIAELVVPGPVRHADTALVTITSGPPPVLNSLSIEPDPDSAVWPMESDNINSIPRFFGLLQKPMLTPKATDAAGQPIVGLVIEYASLDPERATVSRWTGDVQPRRPGPVRMVARTTAYGVTKADTAVFTVSWPVQGEIYIMPSPDGRAVLSADDMRIVPNGFIVWINGLGDSVDLVFDDPTHVAGPPDVVCMLFAAFGIPEVCDGAGDTLIPSLDPNAPNELLTRRIRQFPVPGVYTYHSTRTGVTGRIVVTDALPAGVEGP